MALHGTALSITDFDLFLLSGHLQIAHRLELPEDVILEATRNRAGQYILAVIGRASADDYAPLRDFIAAGLAATVASGSSPSPS